MDHFGDEIYAWDVVNEAIKTDSNTGDGNPRMRETVFYNEVGEDYIDQAFHMARNFADSNGWFDMKLYYNDYSIDADNDKSRFAREMVRGLVDRGVPLNGVGFQMHIGPPNNVPTVEAVADNMDYYISLGLEVVISEMDINLCGGVVSEAQQLQLYHDITAVCVARPECTALTVWGINDENSWLNSFSIAQCNGGNSRSLLFSNDQIKETYGQVLNALTNQ
jgi:endo-1,4-beta-xylanase